MRDRRFASLTDDALHAIAGGEGVRNKIVTYIESGACGLKAECYAIKARTKEAASLTEKIQERRKKKPEYLATDARDIVGIRLLALHYSAMRSVCEKLIQFFTFGLQPTVGLFVGPGLDDMIEEIIVFSSPSSGLIYRDIFEMFRSMSLGAKADGTPKVTYQEYTKDRPYSSIHIVCRAKGSDIKERPFIPVEMQIRTTLEDTWAEVDHQLKYKAKAVQSGLQISTDLLFSNFKATIDSSLGALDAIIDMHRQIDFERQRVAGNRLSRSPTRLDIDHVVGEKAPPAIRQAAELLNQEVDRCLSGFETLDAPTQKELATAEGLVLQITQISREYEKTSEHYVEDLNFRYWSLMDIGLLNAWLYRLSARGGLDPKKQANYIATAISTYEALEKSFPEDAWLLFRLSTAMMLDDLNDLAIVKGEEAVRHLAKDKRLAGNDVLKGVVARQLGYFCWLKKHRAWFISRNSGASWLAQRQEKPLLQRAYEVTAEAFRLINGAKDLELKQASLSPTICNLACYAWELREIYHTETGIGDNSAQCAAIDGLLDDVDWDAPKSLSRLDTLMKMAHLRGKQERARSAAQKIQEELSSADVDVDDSEFMRYCSDIILGSTTETSDATA